MEWKRLPGPPDRAAVCRRRPRSSLWLSTALTPRAIEARPVNRSDWGLVFSPVFVAGTETTTPRKERSVEWPCADRICSARPQPAVAEEQSRTIRRIPAGDPSRRRRVAWAFAHWNAAAYREAVWSSSAHVGVPTRPVL